MITIDGDLFKAQVIFPQVRQETRAEIRLERAAEEEAAQEGADAETEKLDRTSEITPYGWNVTVEANPHLTKKEEVLIRGGMKKQGS